MCAEGFPLWLVALRQAQAAAWIGTGLWLMIVVAWWAAVAWAVLVAATMVIVLAGNCRHCHYCGRRCDTGLGLAAGLAFPEGGKDAESFSRGMKRSVVLLAVAGLAPLAAGVWLLVAYATWQRVVLLAAYGAALTLFAGSTPILVCPRCAMGDDCPLGGGKETPGEGGGV